MTPFELLDDLKRNGVELWLEGDRLRYRAPQNAMTAELRDRIAAHRQTVISHLRAVASRPVESLPLSHNQQGMWFLHRTAPETAAYNVGIALRVRSHVDTAALRRALQALVNRHPMLRTVFLANAEPQQVVREHADVAFEVTDASAFDAVALRQQVAERHARPFDLENGPLFRAFLLTSGPADHVLVLAAHHIAVDGWSMGLLLEELRTLYQANVQGTPAVLPDPSVDYRAHVEWQRELLQSPRGQALSKYWSERLSGDLPVLDLLTDFRRPATQRFTGSTHSFELSDDLTRALKEFARQEGVTLFVVLLAAFQTLLHRLTGQTDILVGTPALGRSRSELQGVVGNFINTVVLRGDLGTRPDFRTVVGAARQTVVEAVEHEDYPFSLLVRDLRIARDPSRTPLVQALFVLQQPQRSKGWLGLIETGDSPTSVDFGGLNVEAIPLAQQEGLFDITFEVVDVGPTLATNFKYNTDLFEAGTMARLQSYFEQLLASALADPDLAVANLAMVPASERRLAVDVWSGAGRTWPADACIHQLFESQAARTPERIAVSYDGTQLTYSQLNERANQLAHVLRTHGVRPDSLVGMCVNRSLDMIVGILAILKAGGAYLPIDPAYPPDRQRFMIEDSGIQVLLTQTALAGNQADTGVRLVYLDDASGELSGRPASNPEAASSPSDLAYVIYTSGSTGRPKGVQISHDNVIRLFRATDEWFKFTEADVWTLFHSYAFDFSVWEIWGPLLYGGRLVIPPQATTRDPGAFYKLLRDEGVTVLNQTPSAFRQFIAAEPADADPAALALRYVIFGGEALEPASLRAWVDRHGDAQPRLINMYGITETTVHVTFRPLTAAEICAGAPSVIGVPIPDLRLYVLDAEGEIAPTGVAGEIYVGGAGVARGYLNRPELNAQRFVPDRFSPDGGRLYRSGDLARRLAGGDLEYLGRIDHQIKIRGFRIELGEIEASIAACEGVREVVVLPVDVTAGDSRLTAWVVAHSGVTLDEAAIKVRIRARLPEYMVPTAVMQLETFPLTANGKIDRRTLLTRSAEALTARRVDTVREAPLPGTEAQLAEIWRDVLKVTEVGRSDNFFHLGGHSLLATQMMARLRSVLGVELPLRTLFEAPTVAELAERVDVPHTVSESPKWKCVVPIQSKGSGVPLFAVTGYQYEDEAMLILARLIPHLGPQQPLYGLRPRWLDGTSPLYESVQEMAGECLDEIRRIQPHGPYLLVGICIASGIALEIARSLRQQGEVVQLLAMIDTGRPCFLRSALTRLGGPLVRGMHMIDVVRGLLRSDGPGRKELVSQILRRKFGFDAAAAPENPLYERFKDHCAQHVRLLVDDRPTSYDGDVTIVASDEYHAYNRYMAWEPKIKGRITFHKLPCTHDMLLTRHIKVLANLFRMSIDEALLEPAPLSRDAGADGAHAHDLDSFSAVRRVGSAIQGMLLYCVSGASSIMISMALCLIPG